MFANLGLESERKSASKHPTGRRHAPREMTTETGVPTYYTPEAATHRRASDEYRQDQLRKANAGPSFMDQIFDGDGKRTAASGHAIHGAGVNRPTTTPKDQLNLFSWETVGKQAASGEKGAAASAAAAAIALPAAANAEEIRGVEARKFEESTNPRFLAFSADKAGSGHGHGKRGPSRTVQPPPFATGDTFNGGPDPTRRPRKSPMSTKGDGKHVQGFKGMGVQCNDRPSGRKVGKTAPSQVFPPQPSGAPVPSRK